MDANRKLELEEDEAFEKVEWGVQRIGWFVWALVIIAGLAGLLGSGPLSSAEATTPDGALTVSYDRFLHYHQPTLLEIELHNNDRASEPARLMVSQTFLDRVQIYRIEPEPERRELDAEGVIYSFPRSGNAERGKIVFHIEFDRPGKSRGRVGLADGEPVTFSQIIYP